MTSERLRSLSIAVRSALSSPRPQPFSTLRRLAVAGITEPREIHPGLYQTRRRIGECSGEILNPIDRLVLHLPRKIQRQFKPIPCVGGQLRARPTRLSHAAVDIGNVDLADEADAATGAKGRKALKIRLPRGWSDIGEYDVNAEDDRAFRVVDGIIGAVAAGNLGACHTGRIHGDAACPCQHRPARRRANPRTTRPRKVLRECLGHFPWHESPSRHPDHGLIL